MEPNPKELSQKLEILRNHREQRHLFLEEWRLNVSPAEQAFMRWMEISVQYAQIAMKAAFVLNGGALVALPPLMQWLGAAQRQGIGWSAGIFVAGLIAAALSALAAYANFMCLAQLSDARMSRRALEVSNNYSDTPKKLLEDVAYSKFMEKEVTWEREISATMYLALFLGIVSYILFVCGAYEFRQLVLG